MKTRRGGLSLHVQEILGVRMAWRPVRRPSSTRAGTTVSIAQSGSIVVGPEPRGADDGGERGDGGLGSVVAEDESAKRE
jgi:hypothetical protein